jgi:hypothetical protein
VEAGKDKRKRGKKAGSKWDEEGWGTGRRKGRWKRQAMEIGKSEAGS